MEEEIKKDTQVSEENTRSQEKAKKKKRLSSEAKLEIIVAVFLGITALLTSWAGWIGSLHGGNQATNYTRSNNLASLGNSDYSDAMQTYTQDLMTWNYISDIMVEMGYNTDPDEQEKLSTKLENYVSSRCSDEYTEAVNWALDEINNGNTKVTPFDMEGYYDSYFEDASAELAESEEVLKQGQEDNANGDAFGLVTVIYSVVLFLLGIIGTFKNLPNRVVVLGFSIAAFTFATVYMLTIPMPTGFDLFGFFK